jgi:hypothetical protein
MRSIDTIFVTIIVTTWMHAGAVTASMSVTYHSLSLITILILALTLILVMTVTRPGVSIACSAEVCGPAEKTGTHKGLQAVLPVLGERATTLVLTLFVDPVAELAHPTVTLGVFSELSNEKMWGRWERRDEKNSDMTREEEKGEERWERNLVRWIK